VADRLDRAPSTAAEHLRKAESALVRAAVGGASGAIGGARGDDADRSA
jgi:hypothetical protein